MAVDAALHLGAEPELAPLTATRRLELAEHLRLPYVVGAGGAPQLAFAEAITTARGTRLLWPDDAHLPPRPIMATLYCGDDGAGIPICARVLDDTGVHVALGADAGSWSALGELRDGQGEHVGTVWVDAMGSVLLPFDPDDVL